MYHVLAEVLPKEKKRKKQNCLAVFSMFQLFCGQQTKQFNESCLAPILHFKKQRCTFATAYARKTLPVTSQANIIFIRAVTELMGQSKFYLNFFLTLNAIFLHLSSKWGITIIPLRQQQVALISFPLSVNCNWIDRLYVSGNSSVRGLVYCIASGTAPRHLGTFGDRSVSLVKLMTSRLPAERIKLREQPARGIKHSMRSFKRGL